ncbi:MAG: cytochrome C oxidase Cbb3 [Bacteroidetes bacterium]|nr:cytochrome C oxidase Cbb3 [Bacteroidota bacterium]
MYKNILQSIQGVEIYPLISMMIFFGLFLSVIVWFFRADKRHLQEMAELPLDRTDTSDSSHIKLN